MAWRIEYSGTALKQLKKLDRQLVQRIVDYMDKRIACADDPRFTGKPLTGPLAGMWRYRLGDWRILCEIQDKRIVVLVLDVGHRSSVYDR